MTLEDLTRTILGKNDRTRSVEYGLHWQLSRANSRPYEREALMKLGTQGSSNYRRVTHMNETGILLFENDEAAVYLGIRPIHSQQHREVGLGIIAIADTFEVADKYARKVCSEYTDPIYSAISGYKSCVAAKSCITTEQERRLPVIRFRVEDAAFEHLPLHFR